jgi:putative protease
LDQNYQTSAYTRNYTFVGLVQECAPSGLAWVEQRNKMKVGDMVEIMSPHREPFSQEIQQMWNEEGDLIEEAPHPQQRVQIKFNQPVFPYDMLRRQDSNHVGEEVINI